MTTMEQPSAAALEKSGRDPMRPVCIDPSPLPDIRFRVLENRESARGMGFDDEEQGCEFHGNRAEIPRRTGTAVPASLVAALAGATPAP